MPRPTTADLPAAQRSRVTNGSRVLAGVDMRSAEGRRFKDLLLAYSRELGGWDALNEIDRALVREAASVTMRCEAMQARVVNGDDIDHEESTRLSHALTRLMLALKSKREKRPAPSIDDYLASKRASEAAS